MCDKVSVGLTRGDQSSAWTHVSPSLFVVQNPAHSNHTTFFFLKKRNIHIGYYNIYICIKYLRKKINENYMRHCVKCDPVPYPPCPQRNYLFIVQINYGKKIEK